MGISVGAGIMVSQYFGAKQRKALSLTIGTCITMTFVASLIVMAVAPLVTMPLLKLLNTPAEIIDWCDRYLMTIFLGIA
jgi:Na+-driven multidrug efflux pump